MKQKLAPPRENKKMKNLIVLILLLATATAANSTSKVFGVGNESCATSFQSQYLYQTKAWIMGFWSARNVDADASVGSTTDLNGIVGEVEIICKKHPSKALLIAVMHVYDVMKLDSR